MQAAGHATLHRLNAEATRRGISMPISTADRALNADRLPTDEFVRRFVTVCEGDVERWVAARNEIVDRKYERTPPPEPEMLARPSECPYPGLAAFTTDAARWFFGREQATADLLTHLADRVDGGGPLVVTGPSGAGKSSLLRAGLVPALQGGALPGSHEWPVLVATPASGLPVPETGSVRSVLIVDQFEELFTQCAEEERRREAIRTLCAAASDGHLVVLGLRADFYGHCAAYPELLDALRHSHMMLGPMNEAELRDAIGKPAKAVGLDLEDGLVDLLLTDLGIDGGYDPGALPLLSHALFATWRNRDSQRLTRGGYRLAGGMRGAIAATAEDAYLQLADDGRRVARQILLRLVQVGDGTDDTRRRLDRARLVAESSDPPLAERVLEDLARSRLLMLDVDTVEITHEAVLRAWPRLRRWIDHDRGGLVVRQRLVEAAEAWQQEGRHPSALYQGPRLETAREWFNGGELPAPVREFLDESVRKKQEQQHTDRRRTRRLRLLVVALSVLSLIAAGATVVAFDARTTATTQRNEALSRNVAAEAATLRPHDPALANQLALAAYRLAPTAEARGTVLGAFATPYFTQLTGHDCYLLQVAFSPDGRTVATAGSDHTTRLWTTSGKQTVTLTGHAAGVTAVTFSPDGRTVATASEDRTARLWDMTGSTRATLTGHTGPVVAIAFSPDGATAATAGADGTVRLWETATGRLLHMLDGHGGPVHDVVFDRHGRLATVSDDRAVRIWDDLTANSRVLPTGHSGAVPDLAFSPDGSLLATASDDGTVRLADTSGVLRAVLSGHTGPVTDVAFSPDGHSLATASADNTARLWDLDNTAVPATELVGRPGEFADTNAVSSVAFSPDGSILATAGLDYTARLWTVPRPVVAGHTGLPRPLTFDPSGRLITVDNRTGVTRWVDTSDPHRPQTRATVTPSAVPHTVVFSPDRRTMLTVAADHIGRLHDVSDPSAPREVATLGLTGATDDALAATFSPDGGTLVTVGVRGKTGQVWDISNLQKPRQLTAWELVEHTGAINNIDFSPDGRTLASASYDHTIRLWDLSDRTAPRALSQLQGHTYVVNLALFTPNGRTLLTTSADRTARLWDVTDTTHPRPLAVLTGHTSFVGGAAFSPDGRSALTTSGDRTARLWDISDPAHPSLSAILTGHEAAVETAAFRLDGDLMATGGQDHVTRLWETNINHVATRICTVTHPPITETQWTKYFPDVPFSPPCNR